MYHVETIGGYPSSPLMWYAYYIDICPRRFGGAVEQMINVSVFLNVAVAATVISGIVLVLYLYFSDGPVFATDERVVDEDEPET